MIGELIGMKLDKALQTVGAAFPDISVVTREYTDRKTDMNGEARVIRATLEKDGALLLVYSLFKKDVAEENSLHGE